MQSHFGTARIRTRDLLVSSRTLYHYAIPSANVIALQLSPFSKEPILAAFCMSDTELMF